MRYTGFSAGQAVALALLTLPGCASLPTQRGAVAAPAPVFSAERFFEGRTEGRGTLKVVASRARPVHVLGTGHVEADGTLVLTQTVTEGDKPPKTREWRIRPVSPGHYAGTLSDAAGPVTGEVRGNRLDLRFRMAGGFAVEQRLYLRSDGRVALNRLTVRKLGIVVAVLEETITKVE